MFRKLVKCVYIVALSAMSLSVSALDLPTKVINGKSYYYYEVQPKETIYSLCKQLGVTKDEIVKYNPAVADGLRAHQVLYFPVDKAEPAAIEAAVVSGAVHNVAKGETIYGICKRYQISSEQLFEANPDAANGLKTGMVLRIPSASKTEIAPEQNVLSTETPQPEPSETPLSIATDSPESTISTELPLPSEEEAKAEMSDMRIAVMLPFMLSQEKPSKQAMLYTDFYKGFLIAVDSLRNIGTPIHITTYDTADSLNLVNKILANPEMKQMNVIIAPDDEEQLAAIAAFGKENGCNVLNIFSVKSTLYRDNDRIMQANIPHSMMYRKAIDGLANELKGATPIFLAEENGQKDKAEFIGMLKRHLDSIGITYQELAYTSYLKAEDLTDIDRNGKYVFIPESGHTDAFHHVATALRELKESMGNPFDLRLFGYPEWTTLRGESLERMHSLSTTIYSRFYNDDESSRAQELDAKFKQWYGQPMMTAVPMQGTLGFDTGMYLIKALDRNRGDFNDDPATYHGVQSCYNFRRSDSGSGLVNETLYFITFSPGGVVTKDEVK